MKFIRYSRFKGFDVSSLDLGSLMDALSNQILDSGYNEDYWWTRERNDPDDSLDALREAILRSLLEQEILTEQDVAEMLADGGVFGEELGELRVARLHGGEPALNRLLVLGGSHARLRVRQAIHAPPLTLTSWPVRWAARSEARNSVMSAMSSGRPIRRTGWLCTLNSSPRSACSAICSGVPKKS